MNIKVSFNIQIDENKYPHLTKKQIRQIVKDVEVNGSVSDYILSEVSTDLETAE